MPLTLLLITTILGLLTLSTALALTITYQYLGFGLQSNPITCPSSSASSSYFSGKYSQDAYLSCITLAQVIATASGLLLCIVLVRLRGKLAAVGMPSGKVNRDVNMVPDTL